MTTTPGTDVEIPAPTAGTAARTADLIGQATAVEQARAVAEVQAAIVVAQQCPRDLTRAVEDMKQSCRQKALAERAFFRYNRSGSQITGPTVHLARELARCFGNMQHDIAEMRRDDERGVSEMKAWAWDVQTNTRAAVTFIVPHRRDTKDGQKALVDLRDVYENNQNMGARRLREAIFAVIPTWFIEAAKDECVKTLADGGGKPLPIRITEMAGAFADRFQVSVEQIEEKVGRSKDHWTDLDLAAMGVVFTSLQRGEATVDEEFPAQRVTAAEITGNGKATAAARPKPTVAPTTDGDADTCPGCGKTADHTPSACPGVDGSDVAAQESLV